MPELDVSEALLDPMLTDNFDVIRRIQNIGDNGRATTQNQTFAGRFGVICAASPNDLERLEDSQRMGRNLSLVTQFQLHGPAEQSGVDYQPDVVVWGGDQYVVKHVDPYSRYGAGFIQAIIGSMDIIDQPPPGPDVG